MSIRIERGPDGRMRAKMSDDDHEHWNEGHDSCGTCGCGMTPGPEQVDLAYAVQQDDGWHIAVWDGECFSVTSSWQSGDRWRPEQVRQFVQLPIEPEDSR